jgi:uncharacterized protein YbjT (DUF2867 family)
MFVVTGANGNTGSVVAHALLDAGKKVRALVRDPAKAQRLAARGAEVVQADITAPAAIGRALAGASGLYLMSPPDVTSKNAIAERQPVLEEVVRQARQAGVGQVVFLSSIGAQHPTGTGPIRLLHAIEAALSRSGMPVTLVRAAYFMENWAAVLPLARKDGVLPSYLPAGQPTPMVATRDIGAVAARALLDGPRGRRVVELSGPRDYTAAEVAAAAGQILGRPVTVVEPPLDTVVPTFTSFGISADVAGLFREMYEGLRNGRVAFEGAGAEAVRGPTPIDEVVRALLG